MACAQPGSAHVNYTVDDRLRQSMVRQVTAGVAKAEAQGYVEVSLSQVRLTIKGAEYLRRLDRGR